jgi:DNA-nicking Smr family endonuclease
MSNDDDKSTFKNAMKGVRRLNNDHHNRIEFPVKRPPARPIQRLKDHQQVIQDMMSDPVDEADIVTGDELFFVRTGIQNNVIRKLKRGQYAIEDELDLHGQTSTEAKLSVAEFLLFCTQNGLKVVRIIHGKGRGSFNKQAVLKVKVNHWLQQRDEVLAFCSARQIDGGTGALYVLLKRKN